MLLVSEVQPGDVDEDGISTAGDGNGWKAAVTPLISPSRTNCCHLTCNQSAGRYRTSWLVQNAKRNCDVCVQNCVLPQVQKAQYSRRRNGEL